MCCYISRALVSSTFFSVQMWEHIIMNLGWRFGKRKRLASGTLGDPRQPAAAKLWQLNLPMFECRCLIMLCCWLIQVGCYFLVALENKPWTLLGYMPLNGQDGYPRVVFSNPHHTPCKYENYIRNKSLKFQKSQLILKSWNPKFQNDKFGKSLIPQPASD